METIRLGSTGMKVSRICLGCMSYGGPNERWPWALDEETSRIRCLVMHDLTGLEVLIHCGFIQ